MTPAQLLLVEADGAIRHMPRKALLDALHPGDLVIANDAATLPASLSGRAEKTGAVVEVRLAGRHSLRSDDVREFAAIVFGEGDFHTRTEERAAPPTLEPGDRLVLGPLGATVLELLGHPRLVRLQFDGLPDAIWAGLATHGHPIQYAHVEQPLALWDVWTSIAGQPVAFEPPSAGFALDWEMLLAMHRKGIGFATLTHAAGISSTGDRSLDARLPFDEPYDIPAATARAIEVVREDRHGVSGRDAARIIAVGTTVVRALEHSALPTGRVRSGPGVANQRIGPSSELRIVDAILTGVHDRSTSHYQLLRAFASDATLARIQAELAAHAYREHEFGDSVLIARQASL